MVYGNLFTKLEKKLRLTSDKQDKRWQVFLPKL